MRFSASIKERRRDATARTLSLEPLEARCVLDASAAAAPPDIWQNAVLPADVNNDGVVTPNDALDVINALLTDGSGPLPTDPPAPPVIFPDTNGDGYLSPIDALVVIDALNSAPQLTLSTITPITPDVTPQVIVTATSPTTFPNGTQVEVDVDLGGTGNYTTDYAQATLYNGSATFDLTPALPTEMNGAPYQVNLRAHATGAGNFTTYSAPQALTVDTVVSTALKDYVDAPDPTYSYSLIQTLPDPSGNNLFTVYDISMTSQTWRTTADVNQPVWQNWVQMIVPTGPVSTTALFLIDGGSYSSTPPSVDSTSLEYAQEAVALRSITIDLQDVPNEPLSFTGDNPPQQRSEDEIIAYTYNEFLNNIGQPGNNTWPALLPMVKSAVKGMDTAQTFVSSEVPGDSITNFVVTGYSKRGWTTWLTAAVDPRVLAIIPGVFDNLNQAEQMVHQYNVYGFFSPAVQAYNDENIFGREVTPQGEALSEIVDPYRYLSEPQFATMPKLEINAAGDEFFVSDSAQYYFHDIPGTENYLDYIPNVGHDLGAATNPTPLLNATATFYNAVVHNLALPQFSWTVEPDGSINVQTQTTPSQVLLWQATNPTVRDFRHAYNPTIVWTSSTLTDQGNGTYVGSTPMPDTGATAFFVQLTFPSPVPGVPYVFTTEIHVNSTLPLTPWPSSFGFSGSPAPADAENAAAADLATTATASTSDATSSASLNALTFAIGIQAASASSGTPISAAGSPPISATPSAVASVSSAATIAPLEAPPAAASVKQGTGSSTSGETDAQLVDAVFDSPQDDALA